MWLDLLLFCVTVLVIGWAVDERNKRVAVASELKKERHLSEMLGMTLGQTRTRLELVEREMADLGHGPAPRSERRRR